jgi:hypothetical protein
MNKPKISTIMVDMDGVLCDFVKRYKEQYHMEPREAEKKKEFNKFFDEFIVTKQFETLDLMPDVLEGIEFLRNLSISIEILSSTANEERYDAIAAQKLVWLKIHDIDFKPNFVPGKKHKWKYAAPDKIIIDDTASVIDQWREAGGIGILHTDWPTTLGILKMYV